MGSKVFLVLKMYHSKNLEINEIVHTSKVILVLKAAISRSVQDGPLMSMLHTYMCYL